MARGQRCCLEGSKSGDGGRLGCTVLCSRKGVPRTGTREVTEVAVKFWSLGSMAMTSRKC